jgi:lamin tail-like protein
MHRLRHLFMLVLAALLLAAPAARSAPSDLVISQIFAGGGNSNAPYTNDFVELFNRGGTTVDLANWSLQYASGVGTTWQVTPLTGAVAPGGRYLVQLASAAAVGVPLPPPDATGTTNLAVSGGKVALVRTVTALACGAAAGSCSADPGVADLIGYGSATDYEGSGPAPTIGNTTAALRAGDGCTDADTNSGDFLSTASGASQFRHRCRAVCRPAAASGRRVGERRRRHRHPARPVDRARASDHQLRPGGSPERFRRRCPSMSPSPVTARPAMH